MIDSQDRTHTNHPPETVDDTHEVKEIEVSSNVETSEILNKLEEQITLLRKLNEPKRKEGWERLAAIAPIFTPLIIAVLGTGATLLYNHYESQRNEQIKKREVLISETQAVKELIPQLSGANREVRRTALLTLCSLNNVDLAIRLAPQYQLDGGIEALEDLNKRIAEESDKKKVIEALALAYKRRGDNYSSDKNYFDALKDYSRSISLNASFADTYRERFYVYAFTKKFKEAQEDIKTYVSMSGDEVMNQYLHGRLETERGNYTNSILYFDEAIKLEFWWPELFYRKAIAEHLNGNHNSAVNNYSKAINDSSNRPDPAHFEYRATCKAELGDSKGANEDRLTAQQIRKNNEAQVQRSAGTNNP